ncbi:hypothetical protein TTHERM_00437320 (macronuclear) [Tetrahymena thermophila SB210]|uniref:Uncharacterized protein n=1 Tax=Tetrahymena thermophila (strain SB210) TaxID=312017 RepID=I7M8A1_TETTS|nr:hypothetical protein TTHERM_00437320 [Tetrahymena thermophila SB210]EAR97483.2 hypothetical protein TTHERM_00437320 [Tetrahymena thermophila SB210]|eukprot:XP_001017728.2 hypothetical protein TTHERM_00437320 [Tetrahymena thermophila SB210]
MRKNEYWFIPYDQEFNRKNYNQINFMKYDNFIKSLPKFKEIPQDYHLSSQPLEQDIQINVANIIGELINFFQPNNPDIYSTDQQWVEFVIRTQLFINIEKYYCLIFWRFNTSNQFCLKRIWAFYVRFLKFLEAFQQAVYKLDGHRKSKSIEEVKDYLHVKLPGLKLFLENVILEIDSALDSNQRNSKPSSGVSNSFKQQNFYYQNLLFETIKNIVKHFTKYPNIKLIEFIQAKEINYIYQQVLDSNDESSKVLDSILNKFEKSTQQPVEEKFETPFLKNIVTSQSKRFQPQDSNNAHTNFLERFEPKFTSKKNNGSELNTLQTNRMYTTQNNTLTSVNTEATDETIVEDADDYNNSSIAKSLMQLKYSQGQSTAAQNIQFTEVSIYKDSPNFPSIQKNPMMSFLFPEVYEFCKNNTKQKQGVQNDLNHKMKFGNESKKDIEKALKKKNENLNSINDMYDDSYEDDSGADNYDDEEEEEQEDIDYQNKNEQNTTPFSKLNFEIGDRLIEEVNAADEKLVQIQDKDIDFDQNKTKVPQIKKTDDVAGMANKYKAQSNADQYSMSESSNMQEHPQNENVNNLQNQDMEDENDKPDPFETPADKHFDEVAKDTKDDDIFDYSYEKDEDDDDESDIDNSQNDDDSGNDENDSIDDMNRQSVVEKEKVKLRVPFTQFKSQIENSFIQFLKESLYSQENEQDTHIQESVEQSQQNLQKKKKNKVPLKVIFPDIRVVHIIGMNFAPYYSECYWMLQRMKIQDKILLKRTARIQKYFKYAMHIQTSEEKKIDVNEKDILIAAPMLNRKRLNACEQKQINY